MTADMLFETNCVTCGRNLYESGCRWCPDFEKGKSAALAAKSEWHSLAVNWVRNQPRGTTFTSEDMLAAIGLPSGCVGQHKNNAVGAAMAAIAKTGLIQHQGYEKSRRKVSHSAVLSRWRKK